MKVIKPSPASVLARCFEFRGRIWLGLSSMIMVPLGQAPRKLWPEKDLWQFWATRPEAHRPLEEGMPRARAEYLVCGHAYPNPYDSNGPACAVRARVGALDKQLNVHGYRFWNGDNASEPQPFDRLPLDWAHSWGGAGCPENPLGIGIAEQNLSGMQVRPLPHIEYPHRMLASRTDNGLPAGFGPIDGMWPQRAAKRGTYDDAWFKAHFPAIAPDADWTTFNVAPEDQQQNAPFAGNEAYAFDNLHPAQPLLTGALPGLRARLFVTQRSADGEEKFKEVANALRAVWFFPDEERAILVFQGMHPIAEDDGADIVHLLGAVEDLGQPRSAEHYLHVRDKRLDKENGAIESLREEDLMPADLVVPFFDFAPQENRALERGQKRAEAARVAARAEVASYGLDPDVHAPPVKGEAPPEIRNLDDLLRLRAEMDQRMAELKKQAEASKAQSLTEARALFDSEGKDFAVIEREMAGLETRGPPKPFVEDLLQSFHGFIAAGQGSEAGEAGVAELKDMVSDDQLHAQWRQGEAKQLMAYRMTAHYQIPVDRVQGAAADATRQRVMQQYSAGADFRKWDLTGADLAGLDLSGGNFEGVLMERANLSGTNFNGANLRGAVLAHADLMSTQCRGAVLAGANLGAARILKTDFEGADLTEAIFAKARMDQVSWRDAMLDGVRLEEAQIGAIDCSGARSEQMLAFLNLDLRGFHFAGARLKQVVFVECDLTGVDFTGAVFEKCGFVAVKAIGARFSGLRIDSGCFAQACDLSGADFGEATLLNLSFRGARMAGAMLRDAHLRGSDFSECDLCGADFARADCREARFVRASLKQTRFAGSNLMGAVLQHARLEDTDYRHANLFQSDLARVRVAPGVQFDGALVTRMRTYPRHRAAGVVAE